MSYEGVPGLVETKEALGETTLVVDPARLAEASLVPARRARLQPAARHHRRPTTSAGARRRSRATIGTAGGRDLNDPAAQGYARTPEPKPNRFTLNYHLLRLADDSARVRLQVWLDDGETVATVVPVWPTADWHEREAWDMMGIAFDGHPNLTRILMEDDWEGHPLRKDYPIGGEPVRFSEDE